MDDAGRSARSGYRAARSKFMSTQHREATGRRVVALLYRRVSTPSQEQDGRSLQGQTQHTREYALRRDWTIGGEFQDVLSGTRSDRPQYQAMLERSRALRAALVPVVIVVQWMDRLGRSMLERARSAEELNRLQVEVHSVMEGGLVPGLVGHLLAAVADDGAKRIGQRDQDWHGRRDAAGWSASGGLPWGYRWRPATVDERGDGAPRRVLEIDPLQEPAVREAWSRAAAGASAYAVMKWMQSLDPEVRGGRIFGYST